MNSRERVQRAVNFQSVDRVPIDLGGMKASSIAKSTTPSPSGVRALQIYCWAGMPSGCRPLSAIDELSPNHRLSRRRRF